MSAILTLDEDIRAAVRERALTLSLATTGTLTNVSAAGSAYTRGSGSFVTNGFKVGDEIVASGFGQSGNNGRALITALTATVMTVDRALTTESAGASVSIASGFWQGRSWEGRPFTPVTGVPYISEQLRAVYSQVRALGKGGTVAHRFASVFRLNYPAGTGTNPIDRMAGALRYLFEPGTALVYGGATAIVTNVERTPLDTSTPWLSCSVIASITAYTAMQLA